MLLKNNGNLRVYCEMFIYEIVSEIFSDEKFK